MTWAWMSGKYQAKTVNRQLKQRRQSGASGSIFDLDQPISLLSALASPLQAGKWGCLRLPPGVDCLAETRAVKSHLLDDAQLTSALFSSALLPAPPLLASQLCFPGLTWGIRSRVTAPDFRTVARWDAPPLVHGLGSPAEGLVCEITARWGTWGVCRVQQIQSWPLYEALPLLSKLKRRSRGTGTRYVPTPLRLHPAPAQARLWELPAERWWWTSGDDRLCPPCPALHEAVTTAAGAFSLLQSVENPY